MSRDDPTNVLIRLQETCDRVAANLVELEIDSSRQLLEVSSLTGRSADRWTQASAALTDLWRWHGQLTQLLERAGKLRSPWRSTELRSLLDGDSVELATSEVPLAERDLLGRSEVTVRCTPEELLARMSGAFDEVKTVVARFEDAWAALTPRVTAAQEALEQAQGLAAGLGERHRADLDEAVRTVARLAASAGADPLATPPGELDRLIDSLHEIRRDLDEARRAACADRAPVEARNQFRALLEAYQVKAQRLGVVEDPELEQTFARAHEALYTAPTDLALAAQLVRRYQELIGSAGSVHEVPR